jgi:hypothetical protein
METRLQAVSSSRAVIRQLCFRLSAISGERQRLFQVEGIVAACGKTPRNDSVHHGVPREREKRRRCIAKAWDECPGKGKNKASPWTRQVAREEEFFSAGCT